MRHHASAYNSRPIGPTILLSLTLLVVTAIAPLRAQQSTPATPLASGEATFIENRGQWNSAAQFLVQTPGLDAWITDRGVVYDVYQIESVGDQKGINRTLSERFGYDDPFARTPSHGGPGSEPEMRNRTGHVVQMNFEGAKPKTRMVGTDQQPGIYNYFIGNDRSRWATDVRRYSGVRVENLYEGIDAVYYLDEGRPRYDLVVAPGADASLIRMSFTGAEQLSVAQDGALEIATSMGVLRQQGLFAYQIVDGARESVRCGFEISVTGAVTFALGHYDSHRPLVIDPLVWSTFMGAGSEDRAYAVAVDPAANVYVAGRTRNADFPTTSGAYDRTFAGDIDVIVAKIASDGTQLDYATMLGGSSYEVAYGLTIDTDGSAVITGFTNSSEYPTTDGAFDRTYNSGADAFVTRLHADGTDLRYSTLLGGAQLDAGSDVITDADGNAYIVGFTSSTAWPTTTDAADRTYNGGSDVFACKISSDGSNLTYSTFIGGSGVDEGYSIEVNSIGNAFITGYTNSPSFPVTDGAYDVTYNGGYDAFLCKIATTGQSLVYSTFLGGSDDDFSGGLGLNAAGEAFVSGTTGSNDFPVTNGGYDGTYNGGRDRFIVRMSSDGSGPVYSTFLGGALEDGGFAIAINQNGNAIIAGYTAQGPGTQFPTTGAAFDNIHNGKADAYIAELDNTGSTLLYSTLFGGTEDDYAHAAAIDSLGFVFIAGATGSSTLPVSGGALDQTHNGGDDIFVTKWGLTETIVLTSPNGSQSWCAGTTQSITWTSTAVTDVKIELSADAGSTWSEIVSSTPAAGGSCSWAIPATQSGGSNYRIRVSNASASAVNDASDADFTINAAPAITAQPSDQVVVAGSTATFSTSTSATASVQWQSSTDGGASWSDISGATSTTLSLTSAIAGSGTQYRAVFDNGTCTNTTDPATLTVKVSATDLGPAVLFLGVTDNGDNNRALDMKVELYRNGTLISSGEVTDERAMGTQLNSSRKVTVPLTMNGSPVDFSATDVLSVVVSARRNGGDDDFDAVLWYDAGTSQSINHGNKGGSRIGNETEGGTNTGYYYLRGSSVLDGSSGTNGTTIQRNLGTTWVEFGTWSMYGAQMKSVGTAGAGSLGAALIPNPNSGAVVTLRLSHATDQGVSVSVVDADGRIVMTERIENVESQSGADIPINTGDLPGGTYLIVVRCGEESIVRRLTIVR